MNQLTAGLVAVLVAAGLGYSFGRYMQPAKVQIKKEEVIKEVEVVKKNVVVVEKITTNKDGTTVTERRTEDRSTERSSSKTETKESTVISNMKPQWFATAGATIDMTSVRDSAVGYQFGINRRILGPIYLGGSYNTQRSQVGVQLGLEF